MSRKRALELSVFLMGPPRPRLRRLLRSRRIGSAATSAAAPSPQRRFGHGSRPSRCRPRRTARRPSPLPPPPPPREGEEGRRIEQRPGCIDRVPSSRRRSSSAAIADPTRSPFDGLPQRGTFNPWSICRRRRRRRMRRHADRIRRRQPEQARDPGQDAPDDGGVPRGRARLFPASRRPRARNVVRNCPSGKGAFGSREERRWGRTRDEGTRVRRRRWRETGESFGGSAGAIAIFYFLLLIVIASN